MIKLSVAEKRLRKRWGWIKNRCFNPHTEFYSDYGGRGITMYDEWIVASKPFVNYCKTLDGWDDPNLTLDRINNDGNYEPNNIRFVSRSVQSRNRRVKRDNKTGYAGITIEVMPSGNTRYRASIGDGREDKKVSIGSFRTAIDAVIARNNYIIKENLFGYNIQEVSLEELVKPKEDENKTK